MRRHLVPLVLFVGLAFGLSSRPSNAPLYISLPLVSRLDPHMLLAEVRKRQEVSPSPAPNPVAAILRDASYIHFLPFTIGTPPQSLLVAVDTGSWEFWVNPNCTTAPALQQTLCHANGHYDANSSSTATMLEGMGDVIYYSPGGGSFASLNYYTDVMTIGDGDGDGSGILEVDDMRIGVANHSVGLGSGIIGLGPHPDPKIGFSEPEAGSGAFGGVLGMLQKEGMIASRAYGMDLIHRGDHGSGAIVFGGLDRSRFTGQLIKVNITPPAKAPTNTARFWARVSSISMSNDTGIVPFNVPAQDYLLDSGTTFSFLPKAVVETFFDALNATVNEDTRLSTVDCEKLDGGTDLNAVFEFDGGGRVSIPYENFIIDARAGNLGCVLGVAELAGVVGEDTSPILGVGFMKTVYTVFDLDNVNIHIAQGASCGEPDIVAIGSGESAVPLVDGNC